MTRFGHAMEKIDERIPGVDLPLMSVSQTRGVIRRSELTDAPQRAESLDNYKVCRANDIVFNKMSIRSGAMGVAAEDGLVTYHYEVMRPREGTDPRFIAYLMKSSWFTGELIKRERGIGAGDQANVRTTEVPFSVLKTIEAYIPDRAEQRAIADYLDRETARIDMFIEEQQRLIELLRERREAVIGAAFLDAQAQQPLKRVVQDVTVGIVVQPSRWYAEEGVPALRGLNINRGSISTRDLVYISTEGDHANPKSRLKEGDVVVVRTGQAGAAAKVPKTLDGANAIDILIIRPGTETDADFLVWFLNSPLAASRIAEGSVGALQGHFNVGALRQLLFPAISPDSQRQVAIELDAKITAIDTLIVETERFIELSRERRAALITAVVTGQIDVSGAA
ncbi:MULTISPECIES: restriction endonuclease subunit S [unclassified Streptomyces]|uniref:restriction endonuclease subunit S n=1 Tax=unclassified Streptomyces TaxID=2593676 RepID=UPI00037BA09B|nr:MULTISPECIES: restriction endonuclease subunit S [unclassified Streptomyces]MYT30910.1 restriction endonuclease subunit S [Streptomyces sp. SID8354]